MKKRMGCYLMALCLLFHLAACSVVIETPDGNVEIPIPTLGYDGSTEPPATQPSANPTEPSANPTEPSATEPSANPTEPSVTEPTVNPTEPPATQPPVNPTEPSTPVDNAVISEKTNILLQNVATGEYLNYDYGTLENGIPVRVWPLDGSAEQRWDIVQVDGTTYRIQTNKSGKYCLDVYRGSSALKAGQECDIWQTGGDTTAQNVVFYACNDGSYIIRMEKNPDLALAAAGSKGIVKLAKFDASSSAQKWVIKEASAGGNQTGSSKYVADGLSASLDKVKAKYPEGTNVSHSYVFPNTSAYECHGFACYALMMFWNSNKPGVTNTSEYKTYHATSTQSYVDMIRPGDLVRYRSGNYDHTIVVTNVDADNIYYADCNADGNCTFDYNKVMTKTALAGKLVKALVDQTRSVRGYILHYKNNTL